MERMQITVAGITFRLYEKSIKVDGIAGIFFFNRPVDKKDVFHLAELIELGRNQIPKGKGSMKRSLQF